MTITTESADRAALSMTAVASGSLLRSMITVHAAPHPEFDAILSPAALGFVADLHRRFAGRRAELLEARRQKEARAFDFLPETEAVRSDRPGGSLHRPLGWRIAAARSPGPRRRP